ncbi:MAG TPA: FAD-dependent oxidoreductase [candidate division Zixibacteria bacterium]|nr:FAD-dependent oxidoreductase [candidate division Zixibacteria bacterium]
MPQSASAVDVLLIGGGVAAARCARTLRRRGFTGSILLVGEEPMVPYNRPPLSKELLQADLPAELTHAEPESWYARHNVELRLGTRVLGLDAGGRTATLADGRIVRFGQCLLATGARPRRPAVPGAERALPLRTLADAEAIRSRAEPGVRAVVIGGGFIGVEVAASLAMRGASVTVLEVASALWGGAFGTAVSDWGVDRLRAAGVDLRLGVVCERIGPTGVVASGAELPADLVVAGVGVEPRVELAVEAGVRVDDGVVVDDAQRTSAAGLLAAGDVARPDGGPRVEHWHAARESGERAALAMLGEEVPPRRAPWVYSEFAGAKLDVVGWAPREARAEEVAAGVIAYMLDGRVGQLAILDGGMDVSVARSLVERAPTLDEVRRVAATPATEQAS